MLKTKKLKLRKLMFNFHSRCCPHCGNTRLWSSGKNGKSHTQRFMCSKCRNVFPERDIVTIEEYIQKNKKEVY